MTEKIIYEKQAVQCLLVCIGSIPIFKVLKLVHTQKTLTGFVICPLFFKAQNTLDFAVWFLLLPLCFTQ